MINSSSSKTEVVPSQRQLLLQYLYQSSLIVVSLLCLMIGTIFVWQRGFYMDDYSNLLRLVDPVTGEARPIQSLVLPDFPARSLTFYAVALLTPYLPSHEFLIRFLTAVGVGANALLLGVIAKKMLKSFLAGLIAGWLFIAPALAPEVVLWLGAATYIFSTTAILLYLFFAIEELQTQAVNPLRLLITYILFSIALFFGEGCIVAIGIVVLFSIFYFLCQKGSRALLRNTILLIAGPSLIVVLLYVFVYSRSALIANRGGMSTDINVLTGRFFGTFGRLEWMTTSASWGKPLFTEAFLVGIRNLSNTLYGIVILGAIILSVVGIIVLWRLNTSVLAASRRESVLIVIIGLLWTITSLIFPTIFVQGQILEYRLLYLPSAGLALTITALTTLILGRRPHIISVRVTVALFATMLFVCSTTLLGFAQAFAERSALDHAQIQAFVTRVPAQDLPESTILVPFQPNEALFGEPNETALARLMVGIFETNWSSEAAFKVAYHRQEMHFITANRWVPFTFSYKKGADSIGIKGQSVPIADLLVFTYHNEQALPIESITFIQPDGGTETIQLPLVHALKNKGVETMTNIEVPNTPQP